jgi:hypothetical protein
LSNTNTSFLASKELPGSSIKSDQSEEKPIESIRIVPFYKTISVITRRYLSSLDFRTILTPVPLSLSLKQKGKVNMGLLSPDIKTCPGTNKCNGCALLYNDLTTNEKGRHYLCSRFGHPVSNLDKPSDTIRLCLRPKWARGDTRPLAICDGAISDGHTGTIAFLTHPNETRKGYALRLALEMKKRLHKNGAKNIQFEIAPTNRRSERIAVKLGAKLVSDSGGQNYNDPYDPSNIWRT